MKVLIVEDEPVIARRLQRLVQTHFADRLQLLLHSDDLDEAFLYLQQQPVDLVTLDLNLYGEDGFELLRRTSAESCHCIIVSAYADQAIQAFEFGVLDFVAKPFTEERFFKALQRYEQQHAMPGMAQTLVVKKLGQWQLLKVSELDYIAADGHYSMLHMTDGSVHLHDKPFERLLTLLPSHFRRIHRSFAINTQHILRINVGSGGRYSIDSRYSLNIPLSRRYYSQINRLWHDR